MLRSAQRADERLFVALGVETYEVYFLALMAFLGALDVLDNIAGNFFFHWVMTKIYILKST